MRSLHRHTQAPSSASDAQEATAWRSPQLISASALAGARNGSGGAPASASRKLPARIGPCLTAMTPDLGLESPMIVAQSPDAKTSACHGDCSVSLTATKPRGSVARPLSAIHEGAPAPVAQTAAWASKPSPPSSSSPPTRTATTRRPARTEDAPDPAAHALIVAVEDPGIAEQRELDAGPGQRVLHGKQQLDPACAAADHRDAPDLTPPRRFA